MAASIVIPKEQLSAYERWELGSFDKPRKRISAGAPTYLGSDSKRASSR